MMNEVGTPVFQAKSCRWRCWQHEPAPPGDRACVIGGGSVGCEAALHLAREGRSVTVVEMKQELCTDLFEANRVMLLDLLEQEGVTMTVESTVTCITSEGVTMSTPRGEKKIQAELVVPAAGRAPVAGLEEAARSYAKDFYVIGDGATPRKIKHAVWEAFKIAVTI